MGSGAAATAFAVTGRAPSILSSPQAEHEPGHCTDLEPVLESERGALQQPHTRGSQCPPAPGIMARDPEPGREAAHGTGHSIDPLPILHPVS